MLDAILVLVVGGVLFILSLTMFGYGGMISRGDPGLGFFPQIISLLLFCLGGVLLIKEIRAKKAAEASAKPEAKEKNFPYKLAIIMVATVIYPLVMEYAGFSITSFIFLLGMLLTLTTYKWYAILGTALGITLFCYALFEFMLGVPLPEWSL